MAPTFAPQVVVVQLLPEFAPDAAQLATATLLVLLVLQVVVVKPLVEVGPEAVQVCTGTVAAFTPQVTPGPGVQVATGVDVVWVLQVVF